MSDSGNSNRAQSFWTTIPGVLTGCAAIITAIAGLIGALAAANLIGGNPPQDPIPPTDKPVVIVATQAPAATPIIEATIVSVDNGAPTQEALVNPNEWVQPGNDLPVNYACPPRADGLWLQFQGVAYGPFYDSNNVGYSIAYDLQFIYVSSSTMGMLGTFSDPGMNNQRNQWVALTGTPFELCVDINGSVFTAFVP
ncbi:MAG: hypothetical protein AAF702_51285 [Chloroflexota bacterium]